MNTKHKTRILQKTNIAFGYRFITKHDMCCEHMCENMIPVYHKHDICCEIMRLKLERVFFNLENKQKYKS